MKRWTVLVAAVVLLLGGCAAAEEDSLGQILKQYEAMESCSMEAVVRCEYEHESREYTLKCTYNVNGESEVAILKPEALQGLTIIFDGEERRVTYKDLVLDAPSLGKDGLSPADVLPRLMDAVKQGWLLEENGEQEDGEFLRRITFETEEKGVKQCWTVLFDENTGVPCCAEVSEEGQLFFTIEFTKFSFDDIMTLSEE